MSRETTDHEPYFQYVVESCERAAVFGRFYTNSEELAREVADYLAGEYPKIRVRDTHATKEEK